jgi:hypothetical protein
VTHDRRPARASGMVPSGRTSCRVGPTPPGGLCVVAVVLLLCCMVRVSARGRADTSPRRTRSGATADSGQARPTRVRTQGPSPSPAAAEPHGFRVAHCQSADDPRAVVATRRSSWRRRRRRREVVKPRPKPSLPTSDELSQPRGGPSDRTWHHWHTAGVPTDGRC